MKTNIFILTLFGVLALSSCEDWFDIDPKTDIKAEDFFETANGFQSALQGVYTKMAEPATYGNNLTFGMLDQLSLMYDYVPTGAENKTDIFEYNYTTSYGYNTKERISETWSAAYNLIANANNLNKWLDKKGSTVLDMPTFNRMKGEVYGLRAFIHFDILRLWGPMGYDAEDTQTYIPYRTISDNSKRPLLTQKVVVENILADLKLAEDYLMEDRSISLADNEERFRFNYYAAKALEARIYNYCGMKQEALEAAKEVIDNCGLTLQTANVDDPAFFAETIFGVYLYQMNEKITAYFAEGPDFTTQYITDINTMKDYFETFTGTSSDVDIRIKSSGILGYNSTKYISRKYIKNDNAVIPLIRLPELYYIMCESSNLSTAPEYVNAVKSKRGYTKSSLMQDFINEAARQHVLDYEYRTEFYAEGQYFHFMKRNKIQSLNYAPDVSFGEAKYIFPLPDEEKEYGWTEANN